MLKPKPDWIIRIINCRIITAYHPACRELIKFISQTLNHLSSSKDDCLKAHEEEALGWWHHVWSRTGISASRGLTPQLSLGCIGRYSRPTLPCYCGLGYSGLVVFQPRLVTPGFASRQWPVGRICGKLPPDISIHGAISFAGSAHTEESNLLGVKIWQVVPTRESQAIKPSWEGKHFLGRGIVLQGEYC